MKPGAAMETPPLPTNRTFESMATTNERTVAPPAPPATEPGRHQVKRTLSDLKRQLLEKALLATIDPWQLRLLRLAAVEAEALAWLTPFPHLFLPVLLDEKLDAAKRYIARQAGFRRQQKFVEYADTSRRGGDSVAVQSPGDREKL
jgi:hypothetical protein